MARSATKQPVPLESGLSVLSYRRLAFHRGLVLGTILAVLALMFGAGVVIFSTNLILLWALFIPVVLLPILWHRPSLAIYTLVAGATTFESFSLNFPDSLTDRVPFFKSYSSLGGPLPLPITPVELLIVSALLITMLKRMADRQPPLGTGPLFGAIACYSAMVAFGFVHGVGTGGNLPSALWEIRSQAYLFLTYLLVFNLVSDRKQVRTIFWVFLVAVAFKGFVGAWRYLVTLEGDLSNIQVLSTHNSLLSHEESFFFGLFFAFIFVMFMLRSDRKQFSFALLFSPLVLLAFLANQRRAGTLAVILGIAVAALLVYALVEHRRRLVKYLALVGMAVLPIYVVAMGNSHGLLAEPARAIASIYQPNPRDLSSNTYRDLENMNLQYNIMLDPVLGRGYGIPIVMFLPIPNLTAIFNFWDVIPHNTILWVWMRTGFLGFVAFWFMCGRFVVEASQVAKTQRDSYFLGVAILSVAALMSWLAIGAVDMGLVDFRSTILLGTLMGLVSRLSAQRLSGSNQARTGREGSSRGVLH